ncbi:hypothetical protein CA54_02150 [Symmachiella macrocystis]|uniref:Uncharacterized protein n=1 Tax=Symmachiella macrocystis TaxID=2527985 RepID=A0A5C6BH93_9PLAN|nr:hypothetical protein [Symmachiella macrocystis]TWU11408.1 hypothetical protein CA54_02150 [Symmachiella macrocystis]
MQKSINPRLVAGFVIAGFLVISLATQQEGMIGYQAKHAARRAVLGKYRSDRMYQEEMRQKSIEGFKNNPHRKEFLKKHPGFLKAHPHLR